MGLIIKYHEVRCPICNSKKVKMNNKYTEKHEGHFIKRSKELECECGVKCLMVENWDICGDIIEKR